MSALASLTIPTPLSSSSEQAPPLLEVGKFVIRELRPGIPAVFWDGMRLTFGFSEYRTVYHLATHAGINCSYQELCDLIHGPDLFVDSKDARARVNMRNVIRNIRDKFIAIDPQFGEINSVFNFGYRWGEISDQAVRIKKEQVKLLIGELELYPETRMTFFKGVPIELGEMEFRVIYLLARSEDPVSYRRIFEEMRGEGFHSGNSSDGYKINVRTMIKRVRSKLIAVDNTFNGIENYTALGYRLKRDDV